MTETINRFFKGDEKVSSKLEFQEDLYANFINGEEKYYMLNAVNYLSSEAINDDDSDLKQEYKIANDRVNNLSMILIDLGLTEISAKDYKNAEKDFKDIKQKSFLDNFSPEEKYVYNKIKEFINESDFELSSQKSFLNALRNTILKGEEITAYTLEEQAIKSKKNIDELFDVGQQSLICEFTLKIQTGLKEEFGKKNKMKM